MPFWKKSVPNSNFSVDEIAFDNHLHIFSIRDVCISAYVSRLSKNAPGEAFSLASSSDYIYFDILRKFDQTLAILSIIENDADKVIDILECDLRGEFDEQSIPPVLSAEGLLVEGRIFKKMVICPQLMDFDYRKVLQQNSYNIVPRHKISEQAARTVRAMQCYQAARKDGFFLIRPYIGVNPAFFSHSEIEEFLQKFFSHFSAKASDILTAWKNLHSVDAENCKNFPNLFGGIKIYPPLDCNPNSRDADIREKFDMVFDFCEKRGVPIVTHCDDQGFRIIDMEKAQAITSPKNWEDILRRFPRLYLDFAHFGRQYSKPFPLASVPTEWTMKILHLIDEYPNVYADVAFNAFETEFWQTVGRCVKESGADEQKISSRILFGTDWPLSLVKIKTASEYWRGFRALNLPTGLKFKLLNENPRAFGFRD